MKKRMVVLMASAAMMMLSGMTVSASENLDNVVDTSYGKVQGINSTDEGYENVVQFKGNVIYLGKFLITKEISLFLTSNLKIS